jgi:hypothetical protein
LQNNNQHFLIKPLGYYKFSYGTNSVKINAWIYKKNFKVPAKDNKVIDFLHG